MNKKILNKVLKLTLLLITLLITIFNTTSNAIDAIIDKTQTGTLTVTKYEYINGNEEKKEKLKEVEFTAYLIPSSIDDIGLAKEYIEDNKNTTNIKKVTNTEGIAIFNNLQLGRYYVCETRTPENVLEPIEPFLVDIPRTNKSGDTWDYDVYVYPKNVTVYGNVELKKINQDKNILNGVTFKLQKYINNTWTDYISGNELSTDERGKITLKNLPAGKYRFFETNTIDGYILDTSDIQEFEITVDNTDVKLTVKNEKPDIIKEVKLKNNTYGKYLGEYEKNTVTWKVTSDVPSIIKKMNTYKITENLSDGLTFIEPSVNVFGINEDSSTLLGSSDYRITKKGQQLEFTFVNSKLEEYEKLEIIYDTQFNSNVIYGGEGNINTSVLEYTNSIDTNGHEQSKYTTQITEKTTAEVHVGKVLVYKTDGKNALQGAKFKIATSKENAKSGIFVTDNDSKEITATSDSNGYVVFKGLAYGEDNIKPNEAVSYYWIVEVEAPNEYRLLSSPIKIKVDSNSGSYSENTKEIVNRKETKLPYTGGPGTVLLVLIGVLITTFAIYIKQKIKKVQKSNEIFCSN